MSKFILKTGCCLLFLLTRATSADDAVNGDSTAEDLFNSRIMPIFQSENPSSCVQCHLSSVDLKEYILPSHEKTFLSLRDQGLVNVAQPAKSKILTLIQMGEKDLDDGAKLIHAETRKKEFEAFSAWIKACCNDQALLAHPALSTSELARPDKPDEVIRHSRRSSIVDSFEKHVWTVRMRCFPCHTPHELNESDPKHQAAITKQKEFAEKHPELVARTEIFRETPEATLDYLISRSREAKSGDYPLLNLENPTDSLLVLKPMSKLPTKVGENELAPPSSAEPVTHYGGLKMHPNDQSYKAIVAWIEDYARIVNGEYKSVEDLPVDNWRGTEQFLQLAKVPEDWPVGEAVQLFVYRKNTDAGNWSSSPVAFTQGSVTPRHMVNGSILMIEPRHDGKETKQPEELTGGDYLVKVYRDRTRQLERDPTALLSADDFVGQAEVDATRWREGFRFALVVPADSLVLPE